MTKKQRIPHKFHAWIHARKSFRLSDAHIQMARELGLSPKRFGKYASSKNEPWKLPLPQFIESLYEKQFGKTRPDVVKSIEDIAAEHVRKREERKARKLQSEKESDPSTEAEKAESADAAETHDSVEATDLDQA